MRELSEEDIELNELSPGVGAAQRPDPPIGEEADEEQHLIIATASAKLSETNNQPEETSGTLTLDSLIDSAGFGWYQYKLFLVCGIGWAADIANLVVVSFLPDSIMAEWPEVTKVQASLPASGSFLGMLLGSVFWGMLADRR